MNHSIMHNFQLQSVAKRKSILMRHTKDQLAQLLLELTGYSKETIEDDIPHDHGYDEDGIPHDYDHSPSYTGEDDGLPF